MTKLSIRNIGASAIILLVFTACKKDFSPTEESSGNPMASSFKAKPEIVSGIIFYALSGNTLDKFLANDPKDPISSATISGLQQGERLLGIDFRPATGGLYGLGSNSRLYLINPATGVATLVAPLTRVSMGISTPLSLSGSSFGFDFNPVVDRIRIVSNTGQNLRANPVTGVTLVDGSINPQPASVNGVAYDNNQNGATSTELYALDIFSGQLFEIDPPNAGQLIEPLPVKLKITGDGGFDIAPRNANVTTDIGLGLYEVNKKSTLFLIDVETGEISILAKYHKDVMYSGIAISPVAQN